MNLHRIFHRPASLSLALGLSALVGGCYGADFDPDASDVFVCALDEECSSSQVCFNGRCVVDEGPALSILGPEPFSRIGFDQTAQLSAFTVTVRGTGLEITDHNTAVEGEGFLQLEIDGVDTVGRIVAGDLSGGLTTPPVDLSGAAVGPHRIRVRAFYGDEKPYANPSATAEAMFFIDDGSPQLGIVEPKSGHIQSRNAPMSVTVAAINWTWQTSNSPLLDGEGHTHLYSLGEYPGCLEADPTSDEFCLFKYLVSVSGQGDPDNPILIHGEIPVEQLDLLPNGDMPLQAGLQDNQHEPVPSPGAIEFDEISIHLRD